MRKYYLDNIRWMTVVLVVIYHVLYMFNGIATDGVVGPVTTTRWQDGIQYLLYPWFMVLLFLVSGMCAKYALEKQSGREFVHRRTQKLLVPSTIGLFVFHWIQGTVNMELSGAFEMIPENIPVFILYPIMAVSGIGVLWFIQMLWIFSVLLVGVRKLEKGRLAKCAERIPAHPLLLVLLAVPVWLSAQVLNTPVIAVYRFGIYGLTFFLGYYLFSRERITDTLAKHCWICGIIAAALGVMNVCVYFGLNYAVAPVVNSLLSVAYAWLSCLAILGLMKRYGNRTNALSSWMSRKSWGLYIFHYLPLSVCGLWLSRARVPGLLIYLLSGAAAFIGAWLLYEIISRIPVLQWCVLGIKKEKQNV